MFILVMSRSFEPSKVRRLCQTSNIFSTVEPSLDCFHWRRTKRTFKLQRAYLFNHRKLDSSRTEYRDVITSLIFIKSLSSLVKRWVQICCGPVINAHTASQCRVGIKMFAERCNYCSYWYKSPISDLVLRLVAVVLAFYRNFTICIA